MFLFIKLFISPPHVNHKEAVKGKRNSKPAADFHTTAKIVTLSARTRTRGSYTSHIIFPLNTGTAGLGWWLYTERSRAPFTLDTHVIELRRCLCVAIISKQDVYQSVLNVWHFADDLAVRSCKVAESECPWRFGTPPSRCCFSAHGCSCQVELTEASAELS